jgi:malate/lactate dehydrogenase
MAVDSGQKGGMIVVLTASSIVDDCSDMDYVFLSVPCIVGREGIARNVRARLDYGKAAALRESAGIVRRQQESLADQHEVA